MQFQNYCIDMTISSVKIHRFKIMSFVILSTTGCIKVLLQCHFEVKVDHFELIAL